jgi:hypothetical protein
MSKVLESLVKGDLEAHLKRVNGLPGSQYGFRQKRSCTSALAHTQDGWLLGAAKGQVVGLMAFDLSAAFNTVATEQLAPTLRALGITGRELRWFLNYMSGGKQCVVWDGTVSELVDVLYGVRQGSILDPILFIILTSGIPSFIGVEEDENIVYADDSNVWQTGSTKEDVARKLAEKAALFLEFMRKMGLSMNAAKTQLLFSSRPGNVANTAVEVDRSIIHPGDVIELLGVKYDRRLSTGPHIKALLAAVRQRASVISRLANHLPRGEYLRQLSYGLVVGKFSHALAAMARPRLEPRGQRVRDLERDPGGFQQHGRGSPRPASRAQTGWWSRPSPPRRGAAFTATTGETAHETTSAGSSSRTRGRARGRLRGRQRPGWLKSL